MKTVTKLVTPKEVAEWLDVIRRFGAQPRDPKESPSACGPNRQLLRFRNEDVEGFIRGQSRTNGKVLTVPGRLTPEARWEEAETV